MNLCNKIAVANVAYHL